MANLTTEQIETMLQWLKETQIELKKDYSERIDKLERKVDEWFESIRQEIKDQTTEMQKTFVSRVEFQYTQDKIITLEEDRKKLVRMIITAVVWAVLSIVLVHNGTI